MVKMCEAEFQENVLLAKLSSLSLKCESWVNSIKNDYLLEFSDASGLYVANYLSGRRSDRCGNTLPAPPLVSPPLAVCFPK